MSVAGAIAILVLGLLVTTVFTHVFKNKGPWNSVWTFFLVQILFLSVVTLWVPPVGPVWYGSPWLDLLMTAFFVAFIMAAFTPSANEYRDSALKDADDNHKRTIDDEFPIPQPQHKKHKGLAAGSFFWMLLLFLTVLIIAGAVA